jgi:hypothetical protein
MQKRANKAMVAEDVLANEEYIFDDDGLISVSNKRTIMVLIWVG